VSVLGLIGVLSGVIPVVFVILGPFAINRIALSEDSKGFVSKSGYVKTNKNGL
jgi:hypothetical protein